MMMMNKWNIRVVDRKLCVGDILTAEEMWIKRNHFHLFAL